MTRVRKSAPAKKRPTRKTTIVAFLPFLFISNFIKKAALFIGHKIAFVLKPFKTKPFRFIGRILSRIFFIAYFKESYKELKQVTWPNRRQTIQLTFAVFIFAFSIGVVIALLDYGLNKLFEFILL